MSASGSVVRAAYWYTVEVTALVIPEGAEGVVGALLVVVDGWKGFTIFTVRPGDQAEALPSESVALT